MKATERVIQSASTIMRRASFPADKGFAACAYDAASLFSNTASRPVAARAPIASGVPARGSSTHATPQTSLAKDDSFLYGRSRSGSFSHAKGTRVGTQQSEAIESLKFASVWNKVQRTAGRVLQLPEQIIWLGGAPGCGKGTNAGVIAHCAAITAEPVVMSSLLESPEAMEIKAQGGMVDDAVALEMLLTEITKPQYRRGVVVDGFPRTKAQVNFLHQLSDKAGSRAKFRVALLHVDEDTSVSRQLSRGHATLALKQAGLYAGEVRETDLSEEAARKRYRLFESQLQHVAALRSRFPVDVIDAYGTKDQVAQNISRTMAPKPAFGTKEGSGLNLRKWFEHAVFPTTRPQLLQAC